jgi:uncharacterized protein (DUF427 family)
MLICWGRDSFVRIPRNGATIGFPLWLLNRRKTLMDKAVRIPGPDHPITVERSPLHVIVKAGGRVIADTTEALSLREASYPEVLYVPRKDVDMAQLERTSHTTYCPYKGECSYYSISSGGQKAVNAVWTYESPYDAVADIKEHLAFYRDRVDSFETRDA